MRRTSDVPTHRPMSELPARLRQESVPPGQFSEANCRMEASRPSFPVLRFVLPILFDSVVLTVAWSLIYSTQPTTRPNHMDMFCRNDILVRAHHNFPPAAAQVHLILNAHDRRTRIVPGDPVL